MAKEVNELLPDRSLTGSEVKAKIGNLTTEFNRKKTEQGKTGASPWPWPFYDLLDKLIGEYNTFLCDEIFLRMIPLQRLGQRPYLDDSLLSDSMLLEQDQLLEDIESAAVVDLNSTQVSEQVDEIPSIPIDVEEATSSDVHNSITLTGPSDGTSTVKLENPGKRICKTPKNIPKKKKRAAELK